MRMAKLIQENSVDHERESALQVADEELGKHAIGADAQQGHKYTGKVLAITDRHVAQLHEADK